MMKPTGPPPSGARPEPCPGDELLRSLLWTPPGTWTPELVWGYFSSRPRRYHLEPRLVRLLSARFSSKRDSLEVRVSLASRVAGGADTPDLDPSRLPRDRGKSRARPPPSPAPTQEPEEFECWVDYGDLILNPAHAQVVELYAALYDARAAEAACEPCKSRRKQHKPREPHKPDVVYPAVLISTKPARRSRATNCATSLVSSGPPSQ